MHYYQSLSPDLYTRLAYTDHYIDQRYFLDLLQYYNELDEAGTDKLVEKVTKIGVNIDRLYEFVRARSQASEPAAAPATESEDAADEGEEDAADIDWSSAFGE